MAEVRATAERAVAAPAETVFEFLRDYKDARPRILTENYQDYRVEEGGDGPGTVISYRFDAGRRARDYRLRVEVPDPGRTLRERDERSSFVTTWTIEPAAEGAGSRVTVTSSWQGAGGIGGFFERTFAPGGLRRIYSEVLDKLAGAVEAG